MRRRHLLTGAAAAAMPLSVTAQPARARVLKFVPQADLGALDPIAVSSNPTRNHAYMIYDTLYGLDENLQAHPQMAAGHVWDEDGKRCTITLRDGLRFHDGEKVLARDAAQSIRRFMQRHAAFGDKLREAVAEIEAPDDSRIVIRLNRPFPFLIHALGIASATSCYIMPERMARTDPFRPFSEHVGSGPYRFLANEYRTGAGSAYARFDGYVPRPGPPRGFTASIKEAHFDRVEWTTMDFATAAAALQAGEIDWFEQVPVELQQLLQRDRRVAISPIDDRPFMTALRFNHLNPPFNDPAMRRALLAAIDQETFMQAVIGIDPSRYEKDVGFFTPGTPLATDVALGPLKGPRSLDTARRMLREAGYNGQRVRLAGPTDILAPAAMTQVAADVLRRLDINLDLMLTDWGGMVRSVMSNRNPMDQGGWSLTCYAFSSSDFASPATQSLLRGNGTNGFSGWPTNARLEALRDSFFTAPDLDAQKRIAREMQVIGMEDLPYIPLGGYRSVSAMRGLTGQVKGFAIFWGIKRS
jgi:ABC-type transport system substrate-binding protein